MACGKCILSLPFYDHRFMEFLIGRKTRRRRRRRRRRGVLDHRKEIILMAELMALIFPIDPLTLFEWSVAATRMCDLMGLRLRGQRFMRRGNSENTLFSRGRKVNVITMDSEGGRESVPFH